MAKSQPYLKAETKIEQAKKSGAIELDLRSMALTELPESIGQLTKLKKLALGIDYSKKDRKQNQLTTLPESLGQLTQLTSLDLSNNQLTTLPESLGQLMQLTSLNISNNQLTALPESLGQLQNLERFDLYSNKLTSLPKFLGLLQNITYLDIVDNQLTNLPEALAQLTNLNELYIGSPDLTVSGKLVALSNPLIEFPNVIRSLRNLKVLWVTGCGIQSLPDWLGELSELTSLFIGNNKLADLPSSLTQLKHLKTLNLGSTPLKPALQSAYDACKEGSYEGYAPLWSYLRSLEQNAEPLYEAKLVLVGEGGVGKTTLLNALMNKGDRTPKKDETTTHGVKIDVNAVQIPHPEKENVKIQLNAWDFGGQEVYRVTHQFFFSRRSLYLLVWEPRRGVQQCQVEDWLNMIRLRVGDEARVIIVSTNSKSGGHIARIDQPVFKQQYGDMIVGFHEVDSLVSDETTGEMVGIAELKKIIAEESIKFNHVGMLFNNDWKAARDELIASPEAHISYKTFTEVCEKHKLSEIDTSTLAAIMNDLGYIVHYADDEKLRDDVVLKPEWLTKAIGFVLENRATAEREGILPDSDLHTVWHDHAFPNEPRYDSTLYPFFLRLMEKYDVCYRLPEGDASLVAQHVPQVRPPLPWQPDEEPKPNQRRLGMVCVMDQIPEGLVPWMIVRTHDYAYPVGKHSLHWQKGMFLRNDRHGEAMLELRGREFHMYAEAVWPEYFMNILHQTLSKLITDNWPGLEGRYSFTVPCKNNSCEGRFEIAALRDFLNEGDETIRCQKCRERQNIIELLYGFEDRPIDVQLREINERLAGMDSRMANYFMATMHAIADEAKNAPRLFTFSKTDEKWSLKQLFSQPMKLQLWCEAENCPHPVEEEEPGKGFYIIKKPQEWVTQIAPYANFVLNVLKTVAPMAAPAINTFFGPNTTENWKIADQLDLADAIIDKLPKIKTSDRISSPGQFLTEDERSGMLALHRLLDKLDPNQATIGLHRVATYTGDYRWLCKRHYDAYQPNIPDEIKP